MEKKQIPQRLDNSRPRILFVGEAVSLAHVGRPALLGRWARAAGFDVHFACGDALASVARAEGLSPLPLKTIASETFYARLNAGSFFYTADELEDYVRSEMDLIDQVNPDLIVGDFRLTLSISSALKGLPLLTLNNAHWSPAAPCRFSAPNAGFFRLLPAAIRERVFSLVRPMAFRFFGSPLNVVRRRFGQRTLRDFREHYTAGQFCAYMDLPDLAPIEALPPGHFFLGPVSWEPRNRVLPALDHLGQSRPLAYVTLGSTGDARVLPTVLYALLHAGFDIALSGVSADQALVLHQAMPALRRRCFTAPLINPHDLLQRAALTVCHAGSGTVYQSLQAGVPLLCLPGNPDQGLVASTVCAAGAGVAIEAWRVTPALLKKALSSFIADGKWTQAARKLANAIAAHDTRTHWLNFLEANLAVPIGPVPQPQELVAAGRQ